MKTWDKIEIIEVPEGSRGSLLYLAICAYAGATIPKDKVGPGECITPEGYNTPYQCGGRLRYALGDENAEIRVFPAVRDGIQVGATWAAIDSQNPRRAAVCSQGETPKIAPSAAIERGRQWYQAK